MALQAGIAGLPNIGKSSLFNAITHSQAPSANFPFCTIEPNIGMVGVPDERLGQLATIIKPKQVTPATTTIVDIAGLVQGASSGEGLGNKFLGHIGEVDAILHVIRCFEDPNIVHVAGSVDPVFDKQIIDQELQQKDIDTLTRRQEKIKRLAKANPKAYKQEEALLTKYLTALNQGQNARELPTHEEEQPLLHSWHLLTLKPIIYVANIDEASLQFGEAPLLQALQEHLAQEQGLLLPICATVEAQISALPPQERPSFLEIYGLQEPGLHRLIRTVYQTLGLITYFTAGPEEVRAWTIPQGTLAPQAAGVIHTDFVKNFIKAEVIQYHDYLHYKSEAACRQAGKVAVQGKSYVVQDGDIIHFKCR